jgi:hypothetical protein
VGQKLAFATSEPAFYRVFAPKNVRNGLPALFNLFIFCPTLAVTMEVCVSFLRTLTSKYGTIVDRANIFYFVWWVIVLLFFRTQN